VKDMVDRLAIVFLANFMNDDPLSITVIGMMMMTTMAALRDAGTTNSTIITTFFLRSIFI
jgi:hypothetical protein